MTPPHSSTNISGLFSAGRSGSTWLGSIFNSHPDVAYQFEPFSRLRNTSRIIQCVEKIHDESLNDLDLASIYQNLIPSNPLTDKPPFFKKNYSRDISKKLIWILSRRMSFMNTVFEKLYTPRCHPSLVFKEINRVDLMKPLLHKTSMRIIYLMRHPCATVASGMRGQQLGLMNSGRMDILEDLLKNHDPHLVERLSGNISNMDKLEMSALLWRYDADRSFEVAYGHPQAQIVLYEELCDDCLTVSRRLFDHCQIPWNDQVQQYLEELLACDDGTPGRRGKDIMNSYFTVYRNPTLTKDRWRKSLSDTDQKRILDLVSDSPSYRYAIDRGYWQDTDSQPSHLNPTNETADSDSDGEAPRHTSRHNLKA